MHQRNTFRDVFCWQWRVLNSRSLSPDPCPLSFCLRGLLTEILCSGARAPVAAAPSVVAPLHPSRVTVLSARNLLLPMHLALTVQLWLVLPVVVSALLAVRSGPRAPVAAAPSVVDPWTRSTRKRWQACKQPSSLYELRSPVVYGVGWDGAQQF